MIGVGKMRGLGGTQMIPSLRVSVFGISRSGKDFSINSAKEILNASGLNFKHLPVIPTVRDYAKPILGKEFNKTTMDEKGLLMEVFRMKIADRTTIPFLILDEHYCFPVAYGGKPLSNEYTDAKFPYFIREGEDGREYEVMLKERWLHSTDLVIYLNPDPNVILSRIRSSEGAKRNDQITVEDIEEWKRFEISSLDDFCRPLDLQFTVLNMNEGAAARICQEIIAFTMTPERSMGFHDRWWQFSE